MLVIWSRSGEVFVGTGKPVLRAACLSCRLQGGGHRESHTSLRDGPATLPLNPLERWKLLPWLAHDPSAHTPSPYPSALPVFCWRLAMALERRWTDVGGAAAFHLSVLLRASSGSRVWGPSLECWVYPHFWTRTDIPGQYKKSPPYRISYKQDSEGFCVL